MAWNHNARNRSAEVRKVNYHEDGNNKQSTQKGTLNSLGLAVIGGLALFCLAQAGLSWIGETVNNVKGTMGDIQSAQEFIDKMQSNPNKEFDGKVNNQGYTIDFDIDNIESSDIQEIIQYLHDNYFVDTSAEDIIYLEEDVFYNNDNYKYAVVNRLSYLSKPTTFIVTCNNISEQDKNKVYTNIQNIVNKNNTSNNSIFTDIKIEAVYGTPQSNCLTVLLKFLTN